MDSVQKVTEQAAIEKTNQYLSDRLKKLKINMIIALTLTITIFVFTILYIVIAISILNNNPNNSLNYITTSYIILLTIDVIIGVILLTLNIINAIIILSTDWKNNYINSTHKIIWGIFTLIILGLISTFIFYLITKNTYINNQNNENK